MGQQYAAPFALDRGTGTADRDVDRIALETLVRDHLDDTVERRRLQEDPALRVLRRRPDQRPWRRRSRLPPNDLGIAGEGGAIGAKHAGRVVLRVRQQLG